MRMEPEGHPRDLESSTIKFYRVRRVALWLSCGHRTSAVRICERRTDYLRAPYDVPADIGGTSHGHRTIPFFIERRVAVWTSYGYRTSAVRIHERRTRHVRASYELRTRFARCPCEYLRFASSKHRTEIVRIVSRHKNFKKLAGRPYVL